MIQTPSVTISDPQGNNNGIPDPGETVNLNIPFLNTTGLTATGVSIQIVGGGTANIPNPVPNNSAFAIGMPFQIPNGTACGDAVNLTINVNSSLGATSFTRPVIVGVPVQTFSENFDGVSAPSVRWSDHYFNRTCDVCLANNISNTAPNSRLAADLPSTGRPDRRRGTLILTSPPIPIAAQAATVSFVH